jgi:hypothetical protein
MISSLHLPGLPILTAAIEVARVVVAAEEKFNGRDRPAW